MTEKISIFDVEISCIKAKEAMMQAIGFMKGDSVNTIELVSMESLMKEHENPEWKKKVSMQDLVLPGSVEILEAAKTDDARLLRETDNKLFLRMFLKYLQKNHHKIYLLADHTKFGCVGFSKLADIEEIDTVITDQKPSQEWLELLADSHVEVVYPL